MKERIIAYCLNKKGTVQDYPFGPDPMVMKAGGKMFALIFDRGDSIQFNLKCDPVIADNLREQHEAVRPGYHMNKKHWNTVVIEGDLTNGSLTEADIFDMIDHSYDLVVKKLPKSVREAILDTN